MARVKIAYLGGGSSRAPGTMASFIHHGAEFDGSEFVAPCAWSEAAKR